MHLAGRTAQSNACRHPRDPRAAGPGSDRGVGPHHPVDRVAGHGHGAADHRFAVRTRRVLQRQAELLHQNHTLAVMEERLTKLLAHADDAVVIVSDQGPVLWTSPSFTRMLGWKGPHNFAGPDASLGGRTVETVARCGGLTWAENTGTWAVVAGAAESDGTSDAVATLAARRDCPARRR